MRIPNTFIIGAPKCGTTALASYLATHPAVFMCSPKEPHYFASDMAPYSCCETLEEYLSLFSEADDRHRVVMEASVLYLYSADAIENILEVQPDARFIVMLRQPVDYLHAYHNQLLLNADEREPDFEHAWRRSLGETSEAPIPRTSRIPKLLDYAAVGRVGEQVQRLTTLVARARIHYVFFGEFAEDPRREYARMLAFLGLPDDGRTRFPVENASKANRVKWLGRLRNRPPRPLALGVERLKRAVGLQRVSLTAWLHRMNRRPQPRAPLRRRFRAELQDHFRSDVRLLSRLTQRDLDTWLEPPAAPPT